MYGMVNAEPVGSQLSTRPSHLETAFYFYERFLQTLASPGGRTFILILLVFGGYGAGAISVPGAQSVGASALIILLLVLARDPRSPGLLTALLSLIKKPPHP